jgi:hypothetical protein
MRSCRCPFRVPLDVPYLPSEVEIGPQAQPRQAAHVAAAGPQNPDADTGSGPKARDATGAAPLRESCVLAHVVPIDRAAVVSTAGSHTEQHRSARSQVKASIASVRKVPAPEVSQDPLLARLLAAAADAGDAADAVMAAAAFEALVATLPHDLSLG